MSDKKNAIPLPILDEHASRVRGEPVWALEEWKRHHTRYPPKEALRRKHVRCDLGPPDYEAAKEHRTFPLYLRHLCTECRGDGSPRDPMIVGCKIYTCEVWPYRHGKNPSRAGLGNKGIGEIKRQLTAARSAGRAHGTTPDQNSQPDEVLEANPHASVANLGAPEVPE